MRRYDDPVEVRRGEEGPAQFLWHGTLWKVRAVLAHWIETGAWWHATEQPAEQAVDQPVDLVAERELWRVEAGRGAADRGSTGVFELSFDWRDGCWQLVGCAD